MEIPPEILLQLLTEFEDLLNLRPLIHPLDHPIHRVKVIPVELGVLIKQHDPTERYFHVEIYYTTPAHADLWTAQAWQESLTKRLRNVKDGEILQPVQSLRINEIQVAINLRASYGLASEHARHAAEMLLRGDEETRDEIIKLLNLSDIIIQQVNKVRELLNQQTE